METRTEATPAPTFETLRRTTDRRPARNARLRLGADGPGGPRRGRGRRPPRGYRGGRQRLDVRLAPEAAREPSPRPPPPRRPLRLLAHGQSRHLQGVRRGLALPPPRRQRGSGGRARAPWTHPLPVRLRRLQPLRRPKGRRRPTSSPSTPGYAAARPARRRGLAALPLRWLARTGNESKACPSPATPPSPIAIQCPNTPAPSRPLRVAPLDD